MPARRATAHIQVARGHCSLRGEARDSHRWLTPDARDAPFRGEDHQSELLIERAFSSSICAAV